MNRQIRRSIGHVWPILIAPWLIATPALVASAQTPDDVLGGRRQLLPVQDVVVAGLGENTIFQTDGGCCTNPTDYAVEGDPITTASGRVFDLENDVIVTLAQVGEINPTAVLTIRDPLGDRTLHVPVPGICLPDDTCPANMLALGDVTGDGYDEIVIGWGPDSRGNGLVVAAAADVASFADGLVFGEPFTGPTVPAPTPEALAIGDLNGDGQGEIAVVNTPRFEIYTLVTPSDADDPGLNIERASFTTFGPAVGEATGHALVVGQFDNDITDRELVVAYAGADLDNLFFILAQVAADLTPTLGEANEVSQTPEHFELVAGRLDWFSKVDNLVLALGFGSGGQQLTVATVNEEGNFAFPAIVGIEQFDCPLRFSSLAGLTLGDFDFDIHDPESPPDLEVAVLLGCASTRGESEVQEFQIGPSPNFEISFESATTSGTQLVTELVASDTQGRSLLLGSVEKVVINHAQPLIVMGAPPMHIDYVEGPEEGSSSSASFGKVNMTAFPATDNPDVVGMDSAFSFDSTISEGVTRQYQTSVNFTVKTEVGTSPTLNVPVLGDIGGSAKFGATTSNTNIAANNFGSLVSGSIKTDTVSGFGDVVWYSTRRFNLWIYRVLGHFACPNDDPDCDATLPLFLTFSGPDVTSDHPHTSAQFVEWYQPHHEVGNILSYPTSKDQLAEALGMSESNLDTLNNPGASSFKTGSSADSATVSWTQSGKGTQTTGSVHTHSRSKTESASAWSSASYSETHSVTLGTLNTSTQTTEAAAGFSVRVPGFIFGDDYSYEFDSYILGTQATPDVLQTELFNDLGVDRPTHGTLRLAFTTQPDSKSGGTWWRTGTAPYLSAPDVALQHPTRWSLLKQGSAPLSSIYCFNVLDRDDVAEDGGYAIKGLFVLPEGAVPAEGPTPGPQVTTANEGDGLDLQARVYNYSRLGMAEGTQVKVQFYGQEWDTHTQGFTGDAFLIDEVTLDPIPGISSAQGAPLNSRLANTTFDTGSCPLEGGCGGKYLKFWLVVWMEDGAGNLVADYREHGLKKAPSGPLTQIGQVDVQPISNNVGYYDQEIHICAQGAQCDAAAGEVAITETTVSSDSAAAFETLEVSARLESGEEPVGPLMIFFYEGDPENGGQAFEVEHVPFIAANDSYVTKVRYQPRTSGVHDLFVVAHTAGRAVTGTTRLEVTEAADPAASTCAKPLTLASRQSGSITRVGDPGDRAAMHLSAIVPLDAPVDLGASTVTIDRLAHELAGAGELIRDADGASILPLTLEAHPVARTGGAMFVSEPGAGPQVRLKLRPVRGDRLSLDLRIRKASIPGAPELCSGDPVTTSLMARLASIDDGTNPPLEVPVEGTWECHPDRAGGISRLRVRDTSFGGSLDARGSGRSDQATSREDPPRG